MTAAHMGSGLEVWSTADGAGARCVFQRLEAEISVRGLSLVSLGEQGHCGRIQVEMSAVGCGRLGNFDLLDCAHATFAAGERATDCAPVEKGMVQVTAPWIRVIRPGWVEEYSVSLDGLRQDFIVIRRPDCGCGGLRMELAVTGAMLEHVPYGVRMILSDSGRRLAYSQLRVFDATGRALPARMEVLAPAGGAGQCWGGKLAISVDDTAAVYPIRIDPTFSDENWIGMGGIQGINGTVYAIAVDAEGRLYVGGDFSVVGETPANGIAVWDGSRWRALGGGVEGGSVRAILAWGTNLYVGGSFTRAGGIEVNHVACWNGQRWEALGSGMDDWVRSLAVYRGELYAGGDFEEAGGVEAKYIARWNGTRWRSVGSGLDDYVRTMTVWSNELYVGGDFSNAGGRSASRIARWDGSQWRSVGSGVDDDVYALAALPDGVYVGGEFRRAGGLPSRGIARWDGSRWSAVGGGLDGDVESLVTAGGQLYAGGWFLWATNSSGTAANVNGIARWDGQQWYPLSTGFNGPVRALAFAGNQLFAGGDFSFGGGVPIQSFARWDGSQWHSAVGEVVTWALNGPVYAMTLWDGNVYVGGLFTQAGNVAANNIARWDGLRWRPLGSGLNGAVRSMVVLDRQLYVGGRFTAAGGLPARNVARWDGTNWSAVGPGLSGEVLALATDGTNLYAGGTFSEAGNLTVNGVARWNGSDWSSLGTGMNGWVYGLAVLGSELYAAGGFTVAGGQPAPYAARWDGTRWHALGAGLDGPAYTLAVSANSLYVGGDFTRASNGPGSVVAAMRIARWDGSAWSRVGSGFDHTVQALVAYGDELFAGGGFTRAGSQPARSIARWNGLDWEALGSGIQGRVDALVCTGDQLFVGGDFVSAGGKVSMHMARALLPLRIVSGSVPTGVVGQPYLCALSASGGQPPYHWSIAGGTLPSGLQLSSSGVMSGTPVAPGAGTLTVRVVDSTNGVAVRELVLVVVPAEPMILSPATLPTAYAGHPYRVGLSVTGSLPPYVWSLVSGSLPAGLVLTTNGVLTGTPSGPVQTSFTVQVTGGNGLSDTRTFALSVAPELTLAEALNQPSWSFRTAGNRPWTAQTLVSQDGLHAARSGLIGDHQESVLETTVAGPGTIRFWWKVSSEEDFDFLEFYLNGTLQARISGEVDWQMEEHDLPAGPNVVRWIYRKDYSVSGGLDAGWVDGVEFVPLVILTSAHLPTGVVGWPYQVTLEAGGGTPPYVWALEAGELPAGLSLGAAGQLSGTPLSPTNVSFRVRVRDATHLTVTKSLSLVIAPMDPRILTPSALREGDVGSPYWLSLEAEGGLPPYEWSLVSGSLPPGLHLGSDGVLSGTPTVATQVTFHVRVTSANGRSDMRAFTLGIASGPLARAIDQPLWDVRTGGNRPWFADAGEAVDGEDAARSGAIAHNQQSWMEVTVAGPGTLNFWWKVSSEEDYDFLEVYLNGTLQARISGEVDWEPEVLSLPPGPQVIRWRYVKDGSVSEGEDAGWVDQVTFEPVFGIASASPLPSGAVGTPYQWTLEAHGGQPPYSWALVSGNLPPGLSLTPDGRIIGTPSAVVTAIFVVRVTDASQAVATRELMLAIVPAEPEILTASPLPAAFAGHPYQVSLSVTGGVPPYVWSLVSGSLPVGLTLRGDGVLEGTPTGATNSSFTVRVTGANGLSATKVLELVVRPQLTLADAIDQPGWLIVTGGNQPWYGQSAVSWDGRHAARSGNVFINQESWFETTLVGPGTLSFWWKVSSRPNWDYLELLVNGRVERWISGELDWHFVNFQLPAGTNTVRWRYRKLGFTGQGQDAGWVDQVMFIPDRPDTALRLSNPGFVSGRFAFTIQGPTGSTVLVETSTNLVHWTAVRTLVLSNGVAEFWDSQSESLPARYYRAVRP